VPLAALSCVIQDHNCLAESNKALIADGHTTTPLTSYAPGTQGLDFETWESIDIDEITPYSSGDPLHVFKHF
jgi:hypothetical protein